MSIRRDYPPSELTIHRFWDNTKRFSRGAFLQVAIFFVVLCCVLLHFDYLKMRAKGKLSHWFYMPGWKVLREDKDGHELGNVEQYVSSPEGCPIRLMHGNSRTEFMTLWKSIVALHSTF